jgi:hypothetical protein
MKPMGNYCSNYDFTDGNWELSVYLSTLVLLVGQVSPFPEIVPGFQGSQSLPVDGVHLGDNTEATCILKHLQNSPGLVLYYLQYI